MPRRKLKKKFLPFEDISVERVRDEDGSKTFDISFTIDANPKDGLSGLQLTFVGAPTPFLLPTLFGLGGGGFCRGERLDWNDLKALRSLVEKTTMLEGEFFFRFQDDGTVEAEGCYFCDDNADGFAEGPRKCGSFTSDSAETGRTVVDDLLISLSQSDDLVF